MTNNRVLIITISILVVLALAALTTIVVLDYQAKRNAGLTQTTVTPTADSTDELTTGDSDEEIQTDLNNTVIDESDQDLEQLETDINSL